jgi:hypothetical protein
VRINAGIEDVERLTLGRSEMPGMITAFKEPIIGALVEGSGTTQQPWSAHCSEKGRKKRVTLLILRADNESMETGVGIYEAEMFLKENYFTASLAFSLA